LLPPLLALLGLDLLFAAAGALLVAFHLHWLVRQPGEFKGAIRVTSGHIDGLRPTWRRGSGRWVLDVLVWNGAPLQLRNTVVLVEEIAGQRTADLGQLRCLGDRPVVAELVTQDAVIEVAAHAQDLHRLVGEAEFGTRTQDPH
jgi:hypothetical protein